MGTKVVSTPGWAGFFGVAATDGVGFAWARWFDDAAPLEEAASAWTGERGRPPEITTRITVSGIPAFGGGPGGSQLTAG